MVDRFDLAGWRRPRRWEFLPPRTSMASSSTRLRQASAPGEHRPRMDDVAALSRRRLLELASATGLAGLAGCGGRSTSGSAPETDTSSPPTGSPRPSPTATDLPIDLAYNELRYPAKIIEGEPFQIGVEVYNVGRTEADTTVTLAIGDVTSSRAVELRPQDAVRVRFPVDGTIPPGTYPLTLRAPSSEPVKKGEVRVEEMGALSTSSWARTVRTSNWEASRSASTAVTATCSRGLPGGTSTGCSRVPPRSVSGRFGTGYMPGGATSAPVLVRGCPSSHSPTT